MNAWEHEDCTDHDSWKYADQQQERLQNILGTINSFCSSWPYSRIASCSFVLGLFSANFFSHWSALFSDDQCCSDNLAHFTMLVLQQHCNYELVSTWCVFCALPETFFYSTHFQSFHYQYQNGSFYFSSHYENLKLVKKLLKSPCRP